MNPGSTVSWIEILSPTPGERIGDADVVLFNAELKSNFCHDDEISLFLDGVEVHTWSQEAIEVTHRVLTLIVEEVPLGTHRFRISCGDSENISVEVDFMKTHSLALNGQQIPYLRPDYHVFMPALRNWAILQILGNTSSRHQCASCPPQ
jgi:hypothetical protein